MEELNNIPQTAADDERKPYTPPTAEIILLAPEEELAEVSYDYHDDDDRWALGGWKGFPNATDTASVTGIVTPADDNWKLK